MILPDNRRGYLAAIEREDGSGRSLNVAVNVGGRVETVYVRTVD